MEENEDEPEDVRLATPVEDEIKKGQKDEPATNKPKIEKKTVKDGSKKRKKTEEDEDCCVNKKKMKREKESKWATINVFEKECKPLKSSTVPRHCLSKKEYLDMLASPSRKCPPQCLKKPVNRKLRPIPPRIEELARPPRQRILRTIEDRGDTMPLELLDNLIKMVETEACLSPEQAAQLFRDKKSRSTKKCKKKRGKIKCRSKKGKDKNKEKEKRKENVDHPSFDPEAVCCQYLMAEKFVKSILDWKCPIPKEEYHDIAEVILKRLSFTLEYIPVDNGDRKTQQMRFLADVISCWISGVLLEVAEAHKKELEEECERRRQEEEEETEEEESESEESSLPQISDKESEEDEDDESEKDKDEPKEKDDKSVQKDEEDKEKPGEEAATQTQPEVVEKDNTQPGGPEGPDEEAERQGIEKEAEKNKIEDVEAEQKRKEEEEEAQMKRIEEEEEAERKKLEEEEEVERRKSDEEAEQKRIEAEEAEKKRIEEVERKKIDEAEAAEKKTEEEAEARRKEEEEAEKKAEEEEAEPTRKEEEEAEKKTEEEAEPTRKEEEEAEKKTEEEEAEPTRKEEEEAEKKTEEEEVETTRKEEEEAEKKRIEEEEAKKKVQVETPKDKEKDEEKKKLEIPVQTGPPIKVFQTDLPFVTFIKIFNTIYNMMESEPENFGQDLVINRLHRAIYENLHNAVKLENPALLTDNAKDVMDVMSGKIAIWLSKILSESQILLLNKYPPEVESTEVRDWSKWLNYTTQTAGNWTMWLQTLIKEAQKMHDDKVTRGEWQQWTQKLHMNASLWRKFHLDTLHKAHHNAMMIENREVVKTGKKKIPDEEKEINVIDLES